MPAFGNHAEAYPTPPETAPHRGSNSYFPTGFAGCAVSPKVDQSNGVVATVSKLQSRTAALEQQISSGLSPSHIIGMGSPVAGAERLERLERSVAALVERSCAWDAQLQEIRVAVALGPRQGVAASGKGEGADQLYGAHGLLTAILTELKKSQAAAKTGSASHHSPQQHHTHHHQIAELMVTGNDPARKAETKEAEDDAGDKSMKGLRVAQAMQKRMLSSPKLVEEPSGFAYLMGSLRGRRDDGASDPESLGLGNHPMFELCAFLVLFAYGVFLMMTVNYSTEEVEDHDNTLFMVDCFFIVLFTVEVCIRAWGEGLVSFFSSAFNAADTLIVGLGIVELALSSISLSSLRILRVFRVLRAFRIVSKVKALWALAHGLATSLAGLIWITVFLLVLQSVCAVLLVDGLRDQRDIELEGSMAPWGAAYTIGDFFGSMPKALFTLFQILTLESWCMGIVRPVGYHAPWTLCIIIPYIVFVTVAVMNVITGIFVDHIMEASKADGEQMLRAREAEVTEQLSELRKFFLQGDNDGDGCLTLDVFAALDFQRRPCCPFKRGMASEMGLLRSTTIHSFEQQEGGHQWIYLSRASVWQWGRVGPV
mmetsp:Transcript_10700/g.23190  ORF Transcript_10700/g.23190 Transcript_10700/m.23190 type:complete len:596 (-) Transcript_10700:299-2086(-)